MFFYSSKTFGCRNACFKSNDGSWYVKTDIALHICLQVWYFICLGTVTKWLKNVGDEVKVGDGIADIATDKASMTFEATEDFFIGKLLVDIGGEVTVGRPILIAVDDAAHVAAFASYTSPAAVATTPAPAPAPKAPTVPAPPTPIAKPNPPAVSAPVQTSKPKETAAPAPVAAPVPAPPKSPVSKPATAVQHKWGEGVKNSPLRGLLSKEQKDYVAKYGRTGHTPL